MEMAAVIGGRDVNIILKIGFHFIKFEAQNSQISQKIFHFFLP